jgi:hypothetical protein
MNGTDCVDVRAGAQTFCPKNSCYIPSRCPSSRYPLRESRYLLHDPD